VTDTQTITSIQAIPTATTTARSTRASPRLVTGLLVKGTAANLVIYLSRAIRASAAAANSVHQLDTNSGILSRLT
jgi:hypothetical protein